MRSVSPASRPWCSPLAFVLGAASVSMAQDKPTLVFQNDAGLIIFYIKPDKTADFEELMTKLKEGLGKMDAPEAKQQAASMKLFKNPVAADATVASLRAVRRPGRQEHRVLVPADPVQGVSDRGPGAVREVAGREGRHAGAARRFST